ncbi:hypothetical protein X777_15455, partial [Ooceraea biroi]
FLGIRIPLIFTGGENIAASGRSSNLQGGIIRDKGDGDGTTSDTAAEPIMEKRSSRGVDDAAVGGRAWCVAASRVFLNI